MKTHWGKLMVIGVGLFLAVTSFAQPAITQPPTNQVLSVGETLTLSVTVSGTAPVYQWFKDSRFLVDATNSTLTVANAGVTNSGTYYVVVTNGGGMVISQPTLVMVGNPVLAGWGNNYNGNLGNGNTSNTNRPTSVATNVVAGVAGGAHSLVIKTDGTLWAMGLNTYGQLGNGTSYIKTNQPTIVASNVVAVAAGGNHSLFIKTNGTLWAMGDNQYGQLGNGTYSYPGTPTPTPICVASNVVAVAAGGDNSLFIKTNGTLWGMGNNSLGQLGNGTTINTNRPICVASNVVAVAAGGAPTPLGHSLFVKLDGSLWSMGENSYGQLGNGTAILYTNRPICVASNVVAIAAGAAHSLFVKTNGTLWATGYNLHGQLGNGTTINTSQPISVASNVVAVAAGEMHSLFVKFDGSLWVMGYNQYGQLGIGTTIDTNLPVNLPHIFPANIFPADAAVHSLVMGIVQFSASVTLSNLNQGYTGSAISVLTGTTPSGLAVSLTYNGSPTAPKNAGSYTVIATINDPNYYGSVTNTLMIGSSPQSFTASCTNAQNLTLQLTGTPNYPYILQSATNLTPPIDWKPVLTNPADVNGNWSFTVSNLAMPNLFYRAASQ